MDPEVAKFKVHELAAATFVPYHEDGTVDYAGVDAHAKDLARHGVMVAFINGTTGDSMALSEEERKGLCKAWVDARAKYGVKVIDHIGAQSISEACNLAKYAAECGVDAIAAMPPQFFKCQGPKALALWLKKIGEAAPKTPLYYYNFPAITGVETRPDLLIAAIEEVGVPQFRGMKFTDFNCWWFSNCVRWGGGKYDIAYGRDEAMLAGLATGALGSIGNGFNFAPGVYQRIRKAFFAGDLKTAQEEQAKANLTVDILNDLRFGSHGLAIARVVYELKSKGAVKLGPPRMPIPAISADQAKALEAELTRVGFFDWCNDAAHMREVA